MNVVYIVSSMLDIPPVPFTYTEKTIIIGTFIGFVLSIISLVYFIKNKKNKIGIIISILMLIFFLISIIYWFDMGTPK